MGFGWGWRGVVTLEAGRADAPRRGFEDAVVRGVDREE
jgi:hypothetical protein